MRDKSREAAAVSRSDKGSCVRGGRASRNAFQGRRASQIEYFRVPLFSLERPSEIMAPSLERQQGLRRDRRFLLIFASRIVASPRTRFILANETSGGLELVIVTPLSRRITRDIRLDSATVAINCRLFANFVFFCRRKKIISDNKW